MCVWGGMCIGGCALMGPHGARITAVSIVAEEWRPLSYSWCQGEEPHTYRLGPAQLSAPAADVAGRCWLWALCGAGGGEGLQQAHAHTPVAALVPAPAHPWREGRGVHMCVHLRCPSKLYVHRNYQGRMLCYSKEKHLKIVLLGNLFRRLN